MTYAEFETEGLPIIIDQNPDDVGYDVAIRRSDSAVGIKGASMFEDAIKRAITPIANSFLGAVRDLPERPNELSVEFGMRVHYEAGAVVTKDVDVGQFRITLRWSSEQPIR